MTDPNIVAFNRSKIYEKLDYQPEPKNYNARIPWVVQQQIAATNGIHYADSISYLKDYPVYELPVKKVGNQELMLDIGCGWGRWLVGGANKGYIPIGIDIRLEFAKTARQVLSDMNKSGYTVVADLENIPFKDNVFDLIWSFSVIQHTHYKRLVNCLQHINRMLSRKGYTYLEFPNKNGIRNRFGPVKQFEPEKDDYNNWCVRYYTPAEYRNIFEKYLSGFSYDNHSFLGIGILKEDLKYVTAKNKLIAGASLFGSALTKVIPPLKQISDSLYIRAEKKNNSTVSDNPDAVNRFRKMHAEKPSDNLNIHPLLKCPKTGGSITISADRKRAICEESGIYYPVENDIPIMIESEGQRL